MSRKKYEKVLKEKRHSFKCASKHVFCCKICDFKSIHKKILKRHLTIHENTISCSLCQYKCSTQTKLKTHMLSHSGGGYFECYYCDYIHKKQCIIKRHIVKSHPNVQLLPCNYCDFKAFDTRAVEKHTLKYHKEIVDPECDESNTVESKCNDGQKENSRNDMKYPLIILNRCDDKSNKDEKHETFLKVNNYISEILLRDYNFMCKIEDNTVAEDNTIIEQQESGTVFKKVIKLQDDFEIVASLFSDVKQGTFSPPEIKKCDITFRKREGLHNKNQVQPKLDSNCNKLVKTKLDKDSDESLQLEMLNIL